MGPHIFLLFAGLTISLGDAALQPAPCDKSRKVFTEGWGVITDGPFGSNYTQDSHCEWLIKANNTHKYITLSFQSMGTECSYDYVFVYDGDSFSAPLLGSFSGKTDPQNITASSGSMLILLYSDTNYVLDGFRAEYSVTSCPGNCTHQSQGMCVVNTCVCEGDWGGKDCARRLCPEDCGATQGRGSCHLGHCRCSPGYSGQSCSLHRMDPSGNRWHWLSHSESGLSPRSAHTAVYHDETDSLYVFGGYNLNQVLGDLSVYRFETSRWEDEKGVLLDDDSSTLVPLDPHILATVLGQVGVAGEERWGLHKSSFFRNLLFSIADNSTLSIRHQVGDSQGPSARTSREAVGGRRRSREVPQSQEEQTLDSSSEETHTSPDYPRPSEGPMEDTQEPYSDMQDINKSETILKDELVVEVKNQTVDEDTDHNSDQLTVEEANPKARYGHAACSYLGGFVLYGGKLSDGTLSDELWYYNATARSWALRALNSPIRPPRLTRHTLTRVGPFDGWLYLFGGSTTGGDFSSRLFRIRLDLVTMLSGLSTDPVMNPREERWTEVHPRGGKELDMRVVAHTTVYHPHTHSLLVYGGVVAGVARFSKLSDRMFSFQLGSKHWAEIHYPRAHLRDTYVPRERAFHTGTVIGNYLVVFGGYSHRHNKEEICYDNQMYLYHLGCQTWISHDILSTAGKDYRYPKQQGVFAHAADVRNGNTLLIVGGYHGNMNSDLLAYTLPPMLAGRTGDSLEPEQICGRHHSLMECTANPECGWCSADEVCYGRTVGINCTTNLQTTRCPGVCPALGDCHSCLIHGNTTTPGGAPSVAYKLRLGHCTWCVQNARCHHRDDNYGVCGLREDTPSQVPGWWGAKGTEVGTVEECRVLDRRPGLTFLKYKHPADLTHPDSVTIINATTVDFSLVNPTTRIEQALVGGMTARLLGFLRPPESWGDTGEILRMCASHSSALLRLASTDNNNHNMDVVGNLTAEHVLLFQDVVGNLTAELSQCLPARLPSGSPVFLIPGRYLVDFESHSSPSKSSYSTHHQSNMELQHYRDNDASKVRILLQLSVVVQQSHTPQTWYSSLTLLQLSVVVQQSHTPPTVANHVTALIYFQVFTFEYLEPYENGSCSLYSNCLQCLTDSMCGWCDLTSLCYSRLLNEMEVCSRDNEWRYLTLLPATCANCSNYISCETCVGSGLCEWWTEDAKCARKGR
uniref:CUB domain-containing protein n=1 Tax=Timema monikensis TaxID=170555 RepID=A0A7R9E498_9NEOP|nr:unnamed protein product [Timema monikensis]